MQIKQQVLSWAAAVGMTLSGQVLADTATGSMDVKITITANCAVTGTSTALNFGDNASTAADASAGNGGFSVTCTSLTPYKIGLKSNSTAATDDGSGAMSSTVSGVTDTISYQLYQDPSFADVWGNSTSGSVNVKSAVGSGVAQAYTVYGKTTSSLNVPAATYNDTVAINVYY